MPTKEQAARQIWLLYFNRTLLEQGIITEKKYNQMKVKIQSQRPPLNQLSTIRLPKGLP